VLGSTEDEWSNIFRQIGSQYQEPTLVLFNGQVESACGYASAAVGPFYCPGDQKVYLDMSFFDQLQNQLGASGDFAEAYVIAHEVGHHVQKLLGTSDKVEAMQARGSKTGASSLSVRLELQADFYAGVWAHYAEQSGKLKQDMFIEPGDIEEALNAASQIGDDKLQQEGQGYVVPDSFTHGTSAQRAKWFKLGYETGDISKGDTFSARNL
jgi:predicted metalloprotease